MNDSLPKGWAWRVLKDVVGPPQYGLSLAAGPDGNVSMIGMKDIVNGRIVDGPRTQVLVDNKRQREFRLIQGDLLLNRTNSPALVGKLAVWDRAENAVFASYLVRYPARFDVALPQFTLAALSTSRSVQQIERLITPGVSQANINPSAFYDCVEIALPPLPEQRRIVAVLDAWDRAIDQTERLIAAKRRRKIALVQKLFSNLPKRPLLEAAEVWFSGVDKKSSADEIPVLLCNYMDVFHNTRITSKIDFMRATASRNEIDANSLRKNDVVFTKDSETSEEIAEPALIADDIQNLVCGYHLAIARPRDGVGNGPFIAQAMRHPEIRWQFCRLANGVVRFGLTLDAIEQAEIFLPSIRIQEQIAGVLDSEDLIIESLSDRANGLRLQKRGLMQKLLTGEWRLDDRFDSELLTPRAALVGGGG